MTCKLKTALMCATVLAGAAQARAATPLITGAIDDNATVTLTAERPSLLAASKDLGALPDTKALSHVIMGLKRSAAQQAAFDKLVSDQQNPKSPSYQKWLKPSQLRDYGPAQADIDKTVSWLQSHGLTVNSVSPSGMAIDFGGSVKQIASAFHASLHSVSFKGETHIANVADLAIPAALAPVVQGATLSNFFPKPNVVKLSPQFTIPQPGTSIYAVGPADFATIYNLNPLFTGNNEFGAKITGAGVTITVVEQTKIQPKDWNTFRREFKLSGYAGTLTLTQPGGCGNPGFIGDEGEAALDAEWSSAAAPDAAIVEAACPATETTFGVETTLQNLVELGTNSSIFSISYGGSEAGNGLTFLTGWANLVEEGASEGISIFLSTGDGGVSSTTGGITTTGLAVNGLSTNAYNTSVGGTDFYDVAEGIESKYWKAGNLPGFKSAKSYVPEIPWDNSCASSVIVKYLGYANSIASCNSTTTPPGPPFIQQGVGGTGGRSILYKKPDWQDIGVLGVPNDGVRDQPDVSLFASNGSWNHFYVFCMSDANEGGTACDYRNVNDVFGNAAGGTSFAAPAFAGIMALVVQAKGHPVGNAAPRLYQLGQQQFANSLLLQRCNATLGKNISTACVFNDVTVGNNAEPCVGGTPDCYANKNASQGIGVLSANPGPNQVDAYPANRGYSLATGLGTVNVTNLLYNY